MGTNTGIGIGIGIPFRNNALGGDNMYFPPELKARMIGVWDNYGKKNTDADRNIIKNKIPNAGGDLEILNSAYKLNSGFGKYEVDFTSWIQTDGVIASSDKVQNSIVGRFLYFNTVNKKEDVPSFKVNITLGQQSKLQYNYIKEDGTSTYIVYSESGIYTIPASYFSKYTGGNAWFGFYQIEGTSIIEQIPSFEGALVTDGINDIIASIKTLEEWNIGDKGITIVSMIHQINTNSNNFITTNNIRTDNKVVGRNIVSNIEKTGIYGWYKENIQSDTINVINNILGDKNDYISHSSPSTNINPINNSKFYVQGYAVENDFIEISSIAHYWTFAVLDKATEDEINLIIAKYNLDRTLRPDILCNITKQGITNDNHADFNDKLIDYSGNGRDIQMNNLAWKGGSGIAAKQYETFKDWTSESSSTSIITQIDEFTRIVESTTNGYWVSRIRRDSDLNKVYDAINVYLYQDNNFLVHECKYEVDGIKYAIPINESVGKGYHKLEMYTKDRYTELPENAENVVLSEWYFPKSTKGSIKYSIIPSCKGGILLDGINDFGKVTGMPVYKDYTIVVDYERISGIEQAWAEALISKSYIANQGAFVLMETNGTAKHSYSFGAYTTFNKDDSTRTLLYQSKYKCGDIDLNAGTGVDGDTLWLGTYRDNYSSFFNGAIYSLMSFPYSMSEFLIERQLKKHKLGTLYPDMVEFRPVIKSNASYDSIVFYYKNEKVENGTYLTVGSSIGMHIRLSSSPVNEIKSITVNGIPATFKYHDANNNIYQYDFNLTSKSPQKINITIDEYIRFEDIVQPYPVLLRFKDENGNEVSWGGKFKVGSTITRIGSIADPESNLLNGLYSISGLSLNGKGVTSSTSIVEKQMVFKTIATYLLDNNEPKCILSPRLLRIPNSSYKILGHIPDISGHGNHGKINNSAYKLNSGVNGYLVDFTTLKDDGIKGIVRTDSKIYLDKSFNYNQGFWLGRTNNPSPAYKVKVSGIPETGMLTYTGGVWLNLVNGINELPARTNTEEEHGFVIQSPNLDWSNLVIEQIGEYEGAYCLDGVDDFVTIPTIAGKQVLIKLNWQNKAIGSLIYDQRDNGSTTSFAIMPISINDTTNNKIAYQTKNANGITYIDGIRNEYIESYSLENIIHNITITNPDVSNKTVALGASNRTTADYFAKYALYDFMLFDEISTDDKIKELNEYVGIEAKVELPPYYWDAYGKTNSDDDRSTIQQRGTAVGDYDLTNSNFAYEGMSGYNGYPVVFGVNKTWEQMPTGTFTWNIDDNKLHITKALIAGNGLLFSYVKLNGSLLNVKEIPSFKIKVSGLEGKSKLWYRYLKTEDAISETTAVLENGTHELPKSYTPSDSLHDGVWIGFTVSPISEGVKEFDCDITIEVLPKYENGLVYDGITNYSKNANIPAFDDFTAIIKREWLKKQGCPLIKGSKVYEGGNGNALLLEWDKAYNFVFYKRTDIMEGELPDNISFITPTNYNGNVITRGSEQDTNGICIAGDGNAGFANMVFYKLILYPKTIPLLQINFLKNLMEKDEIIDLNNPIFIKDE